jgi:flagellin
MAAVLSTNMASLYAQKNLSTAQSSLAQSVQRLSSGTRISSAKDDAAGFGISQSLTATKNTINEQLLNVQNGISYATVADGALDVVGKILQRALTLSTESQDPTLNTSQQASIQNEMQTLQAEITSIKQRTKFQGGADAQNVFDGPALSVQTGSNTPLSIDPAMIDPSNLLTATTGIASVTAPLSASQGSGYLADNGTSTGTISLSLSQTGNPNASGAVATVHIDSGKVTSLVVTSAGSGYNTTAGDTLYFTDAARLNGSGFVGAAPTLVGGNTTLGTVNQIQDLIASNATNRGTLGAAINSLNYTADNMQTLSNNLADSISRIVDTDYAAETANLTKTQILQQAATSMLAQANQMPNVILTLLK